MYGGVFSGIKRGSSFQLQCIGLNIMVIRIFVLEIWERSNRSRGWVTLLSTGFWGGMYIKSGNVP